MEETYTAKDVIEMAIQAKERGVKLYLFLARNSENYHVGKLFMELAKEAQRYKHELEKWHESISPEKREEAYPGERALYLKALVDANTYSCNEVEKRALERTVSEEEALQAGINFKKDFLLFLQDLKHHIAKEDSEVIDRMTRDEVQHIKDIFHLKEKIHAEK